jgi:serine/threonine protein kinase
LNEFEIVGQLGEGGFSIVYLAWDHSLERQIALKEYMPSGVASRSQTSLVSVRSEHQRPTFDLGLKSFINEAKLLAQFDHPALVKVYRFWEANGTAYMAMPFYQGLTFKETVQAMSEPPGERWLLDVLDPLTASLDVIHAKHCYHRDIAPDNIIILDGGMRPVLLDFGAARRVIGNITQSLTIILKPGYAPVEQYAEIPGLAQGAWTDVYALGATTHWAITGRPPPLAVGRTVSDSYLPLVDVAHGRYSASFLQAIDRALHVLPAQRTSSIEAFRQELGIGPPSVATSVSGVDPESTIVRIPARTDPTPHSTPDSIQRSSGKAPPPVRFAPHSSDDHTRPMQAHRGTVSPKPPGTGSSLPSVPNARPYWILGSLMALTVAGVAVFFSFQRSDEKPSTPESSTTQVPAEPPATQRGPALVDAGTAPPSNTPSTSEASIAPSAPAPKPTPAAPPALSRPAPADKEPPAPASQGSRKPQPEASVTAARTTRKKTESDGGRECARLMTQLSLGDDDPSIAARLRALNCQ